MLYSILFTFMWRLITAHFTCLFSSLAQWIITQCQCHFLTFKTELIRLPFFNASVIQYDHHFANVCPVIKNFSRV